LREERHVRLRRTHDLGWLWLGPVLLAVAGIAVFAGRQLSSSLQHSAVNCATPAAATGVQLAVNGGVAKASFGIATGCHGVHISLASYRAPSSNGGFPQQLNDSSTGTFDNGGPYTLTAAVAPCYYQVDLVLGAVIPVLSHDHQDIQVDIDNGTLYGNRKLRVAHGGTASCSTIPPPKPPPGNPPPGSPPPSSPPPTGTTPSSPPTTTGGGSVAPPPSVDVQITKVASAASVSVGDTVTYTETVRNNGPASASGVVVVDALPPGLTLISVSATRGSCPSRTPLSCSIGSLANGASVTIRVVVRATRAGTIVNRATVTENEPDSDLTNNTSAVPITVRAPFVPPTARAPAHHVTVAHGSKHKPHYTG
jgi:uncharacterized repeat protein (TIGR01451 family)